MKKTIRRMMLSESSAPWRLSTKTMTAIARMIRKPRSVGFMSLHQRLIASR
jgi:hypothetical protein